MKMTATKVLSCKTTFPRVQSANSISSTVTRRTSDGLTYDRYPLNWLCHVPQTGKATLTLDGERDVHDDNNIWR